jgi:hypothetical protein
MDFTKFESRDAPKHTAGLSPTSLESPVQEQSTEQGTPQKDIQQATVLPTPVTTPDPDYFAVDPAYLLQIDLFDDVNTPLMWKLSQFQGNQEPQRNEERQYDPQNGTRSTVFYKEIQRQ